MKTMRLLLVFAVAALTVASVANQAHAANLLGNPNFETGLLAPWTIPGGAAINATVTFVADNGPAYGGTLCAYMNNQALANGLTLAQTTANGTATPGLVYFQYDLKSGPTAAGGVFFVEVFAQNSVGAVIGNAGLQGNYTPATWTTYGGSFIAPAGTDHLTIQFEDNTGAAVGSQSAMYIDNTFLGQTAPVAVTQTTWGQLKKLYR